MEILYKIIIYYYTLYEGRVFTNGKLKADFIEFFEFMILILHNLEGSILLFFFFLLGCTYNLHLPSLLIPASVDSIDSEQYSIFKNQNLFLNFIIPVDIQYTALCNKCNVTALK